MYLSSDLFFQKQGLFNNCCGKYALNNLLGSKEISTQMLDAICKKFEKKFKQDYKHTFGGDYDINILIEALRVYEKECKWLSGSKQDIGKSSEEHNPQRVGYLINRQMKPNILKEIVGYSDRHWIAVRQYNSQYYLLDSKSEGSIPQHIINIAKFLENEKEKGSHILEVLQLH